MTENMPYVSVWLHTLGVLCQAFQAITLERVIVFSHNWMFHSSKDLWNPEYLTFIWNFHQQFIHFIHSLFPDAEYCQTHDQSLSQLEGKNEAEWSSNMQHVTKHKHSGLSQIVFLYGPIIHIMQYNLWV